MEPTTHQYDLRDGLEDIEHDIGLIREKQKEIAEEAEKLDPQDDDESSRYNQLIERYDSLETDRVHLVGYREAIEAALEEWNGSVFEMREMTGQETRMLKDNIRRGASEHDIEGFPSGAWQVKAIQKIVESTPPGCPDPDDIHGLPDRLFSWLWERANAVNTVGDVDLGNSSLQDEIARLSDDGESGGEQSSSKTPGDAAAERS